MKKTAGLLAGVLLVCVLGLKTAYAFGGRTTLANGQATALYENRDTTGPVTIDLTISYATDNTCCPVTATWTDATGIAQSLTIQPLATVGVRTTLPPAGGAAPAAITLTNQGLPVTFTWTVDRVN
jgi:hypothetical protein